MTDWTDNSDQLLQSSYHEIVVDPERLSAIGSNRLDHLLVSALTSLSRSRIRKLIDEGQILLNGTPVKAGHMLKGGEHIQVTVPAPEPLQVIPQAIPLQILYQDQYLAVINKPVGMVTHPGAGVFTGTLVNALLHHIGSSLSGISGAIRPGIVHRLDKDTSGLLVIAKEEQTHKKLADQIRHRQVQRIYIALVEGVLKKDQGTIEAPIGRHPTQRTKMAVVERGKPAITEFQVLQRFSKSTLIRVKLQTGRTHQIRVHMSHLGYPIVGDLVYNSKSSGSEAARRKLGLQGHALHANQLRFTHPITCQLLEFEAPLPEGFQALIQSLK